MFAIGPDGDFSGVSGILTQRGEWTVDEQHRAGWMKIAGRTEGGGIVDILRRAVHPERSARLNGISSLSMAKKYCLKNSPMCSNRYRNRPTTG